VVTGMGPGQGVKMNRQEYFAECSRLSSVMAEKNEAFADFVAANPVLSEEYFEEFDAHQAALSKAIGDWQHFCDANRGSLRR